MELLTSIFFVFCSGEFQDSQTSFLLIFLIQSSTICKDGQQVESLFSFKENSVAFYFSAAHISSRKGRKGTKPSSSAGSRSSFMSPLASSLVSFSPRLVRRRKSSFSSMVLSSFLS